jgi:hypothetical protein
MLFDAGSFAVSVACLVRLRPRVAEQGTEETPPPFLTAIHDGWRAVTSRSWVVAGLGAMCAYAGIVLPAVYVLGPVIVSDEHGGPGAWAAVGVAFGLGCVLGDLLLLRIRPRHALRTAGAALLLASGQAAIYGSGAPLAGICALQFVAGIGVTAFFTLWEVSLQEHIPGDSLSRVSSFDYLASTILMPIGTAIAGPVATSVGTHATLVAMSAIGVACALGFLAVPAVRSLPRGTGAC